MSPNMPFPLAPLTIVVGHYGVGKTNFSLNIALDAAQAGSTSEEEGQGGRAREARAESQGGRAREARAKLIDLDVVNPYFRSSDHRGLLERQGIQLISPCFAGSALDVPSLSAAIMPAIEAADAHCPVIIDAGGDDQGAVALGRFANQIARRPYAMLSVVNAY
ncbi:MAG: hypothetical protein LBG81_03205, partial [Coriobacteriaceae bacterium]|nr:hypothetical protein [Coriobacteriaceae bacterium]